MSRMRWENLEAAVQQQQLTIQFGAGEMGSHHWHRDAFQGNTLSAVGYGYGYAPSSSYSSMGSVGYT